MQRFFDSEAKFQPQNQVSFLQPGFQGLPFSAPQGMQFMGHLPHQPAVGNLVPSLPFPGGPVPGGSSEAAASQAPQRFGEDHDSNKRRRLQ